MSRAAIGLLSAFVLFTAGSSPSGGATRPSTTDDEYCCAADQNLSGWISTEFNLLSMEWGWPEADPRALAACAQLGGYTVAANGRIDTTKPGAFEEVRSTCEKGRLVYTRRMGPSRDYYVQVRFLCTDRYPCGGARYILSRAVKVLVTGLPPPQSFRFRPPARIRSARVGRPYRRGFCRPAPVRGHRCGEGSCTPQDPSGGSRPYGFILRRERGPLPPGLSLTKSGWLRGTPRRRGSYLLRVCAYDHTGHQTICRRVALRVNL